MKNNKAFTIAELILTTVIMAIVMIIAPTVTIKRVVKPKVIKKFNYIAKCAPTNLTEPQKCIYDTHNATLKIGSNIQEKLDYNKNSNEFYTIELVGGGAGGTSKSFGYPGESISFVIPSLDGNETKTSDNGYNGILTGYYLLQVGKGGSPGDFGDPTIVCAITKEQAKQNPNSLSCDDESKIIAKAMGGIYSNEPTGELNQQHDSQNAGIVSTEDDENKKSGDGNEYGKGGDIGNSGNSGTVVIK